MLSDWRSNLRLIESQSPTNWKCELSSTRARQL